MNTTQTPEALASARTLKAAALAYQIAEELYKAALETSHEILDGLLAEMGTTEDELLDNDQDDLLAYLEKCAEEEANVVFTNKDRSEASDLFCAAWADVLVSSGQVSREDADHLATRLPIHRAKFREAVELATRYSGE